MAGDFGDEVRVLDFLIQIADQNTAGHVGGSDFPDGMFLFLAGYGVQGGHHAIDAGKFDHLLDVSVVILLTNKGKKAPVGLVLVSLQDLQCGGRERDPDRIGTALLCLPRNVFDGAVDDIGLGHFHQVADAAANEALENEDVTLKRSDAPGLGCNIVQIPITHFRIIYLQKNTVVRSAEPYFKFPIRYVDNLRIGFVKPDAPV